MQDLFQNYVDDLNKFRDAFHDELAVQARELSMAMGNYSQRCEAALASFMEKIAARGVEVEEAAAARFNAFRGLPVDVSLPDVSDGPFAQTPTNEAQETIETVAERAVADSLHVESDGDRKLRSRSITLVRSDPAA
jgi:predicted component of type VI protein secretion system